MTSAKDGLAALGLSVDEAVETDAKLKKKVCRDPRICICGHAVNKHTVVNGIVMCNPSRMNCPCKSVRPVIEVDDTRRFLRKTTGPGYEHALIRGIAALHEIGKGMRWIEPPKCDRCSATEGRIVPVPITAGKTVAYEATGRDALLCEKCLGEI